jgi:hypothetical protein
MMISIQQMKYMKNSGGIKIIMIAALALMILTGTGAAVSLSNSGGGTWKYQREINIMENSGTSLIDYQILIELKANDFPEEAQSSGADIRFTDANGKELSYWMEGRDLAAKIGMVWVKVPNIPANGDARIRMYYGNPNAKSSSNGDATFEFFDDFDGTNLDSKKWKVEEWENHSISGKLIDINEGKLTLEYPVLVRNINTFSPPAIFEAKLTLPQTTDTGEGIVFGGRVQGFDYSLPIIGFAAQSSRHHVVTNSQGTLSVSDIETKTSEQIYTIKWKDDETIFQRSYLTVASYKSNIPVSPLYVQFIKLPKSPNKDKLIVDWTRVRKYMSPEPTIESSLFLKKYASSYSIKQSEETAITIFIKNYLDTDITDITISDSMHPRFDLSTGDFPYQKKYEILRSGESHEIRYSIKAKKIGDFTLDPVTVTYADSEGNIQEIKSNPVLIHVLAASKGAPGLPTDQKSRNASLSLHGEKTEFVLGEDILIKLSALSLITKPKMHAQLIIIPPSGISVTSSEFIKDAAGQFSSNFELEPGAGRDIEVKMKSNQVGDFNIKASIIYYFGEEKDKVEDQTLELPITVRKEPGQTVSMIADQNAKSTKNIPGFGEEIVIVGISLAAMFKSRCKK